MLKPLIKSSLFAIFSLNLIFASGITQAEPKSNLGWQQAVLSLLLDEDSEVSEEDTEPEPEVCEQGFPNVDIVNLGVDVDASNPSCLVTASPKACVIRRIKSALPKGCRKNIDVFVPGTNQEDGNWRQFTSLVSQSDNRGALSLNYVTAGDFGGDFLRYDDGVKSAFDRLPILLDAIRSEFKPDNVRVYGHSKGSHPVALLADVYRNNSRFKNFKFYAFGQAGRTTENIDDRTDIKPGKPGDKGYIQKLSSNLVGITWSNDEVRPYKGDGFNGLKMPDRWFHAGRVNDASEGSIRLQGKLRIDHHGTYGGTFINEDAFPYCVTGRWKDINDSPRFSTQCGKRDELFRPYFWGDAECSKIAWDMLESDDPGAPNKVWIGSSGPRAETGCQEDLSLYRVSYTLKYRYNRADQQCKLNLKVAFKSLNGRPAGGTISTTASDGNTFQVKTKTGSVNIPPHSRMVVTASLSEQNTDGPGPIVFKCDKTLGQTETYIDYLDVTYTDKLSGDRRTVSLIGNREGADYPVGSITGKAESGWKKESGAWRMEYDTILTNLKIEGETKNKAKGEFSKIIHLID